MKHIDEYGRISRAFWQVFKEYVGISQEDERWELLVSEFDLIAHNYLNTDYELFTRRMYITFLRELEKRSRPSRALCAPQTDENHKNEFDIDR